MKFSVYASAFIAAIGLSPLFSLLPSSQQSSIVRAVPVNAIGQSAAKNSVRSGFTRYAEPSLYSVDYPQTWFLSKPAAYVTSIQNRQPSGSYQGYPADYINTEIYFRTENLEAAVAHLTRTNDSRYQPGTLTKQGTLTVGGKEAVRLWFEGGRFGEDRMVTLIHYADEQTAVISSYFTSGETWGISDHSRYSLVVQS